MARARLCRLEFRLCRRLRAGAGNAFAAGTQQGSSLQRFPGVRDDGGGIVFFRPVARELRLVGVVYPPVLLGLVVLALASFARRRRSRLQAVAEFPDPAICKIGQDAPLRRNRLAGMAW